MGRAILIVVVLMSAVYAGIILRMHKKMIDLPNQLIEVLLNKQAENTSDYILRSGIQDAAQMGIAPPEYGVLNATRRFTNWNIGVCTVDSIQYSFVTSLSTYFLRTYIHGNLQGKNINYDAEMSYNFPLVQIIGDPDGLYLQCDQPQFHGANEYVRDDSPYANDGVPMGHMGTRPKGIGWKCATFDGTDDYIDVEDSPGLQVDSTFTFTVWARMDKDETAAALIWLSSDPYDGAVASGGHPGQNLHDKPSGAIWYTSTPTKQMHFACTLRNYYVLQVDASFVPTDKWPYNKGIWSHFALVFNRGILTAYIDGVSVGSVGYLTSLLWKKTITPYYGLNFGRKDIQLSGHVAADYWYLEGELDQMGVYMRALTAAEIGSLYQTWINQLNMMYIRD